MGENRTAKSIIYEYGNNKTKRQTKKQMAGWREDGKMVGGEEWQEKVYEREEWKRLLRTARNHRILHMPID
jgi:hypothetical protein